MENLLLLGVPILKHIRVIYHNWQPVMETYAYNADPVQTIQNKESGQGQHWLLAGISLRITILTE